jgi:hypothetical protein
MTMCLKHGDQQSVKIAQGQQVRSLDFMYICHPVARPDLFRVIGSGGLLFRFLKLAVHDILIFIQMTDITFDGKP